MAPIWFFIVVRSKYKDTKVQKNMWFSERLYVILKTNISGYENIIA